MTTTQGTNIESITPDLRIYAYATDALPHLLTLLQTTLGNSGAVRKTEAFWQWKHHVNPFGSSYGLYAWDEAAQRAAGLRVLIRWRFRAPSGAEVHGARAVDTATHPAYQRLGLFSALTRQAIAELQAAGVDCIFNTPNSKSLPGYLKLGWQIAARWPLYLKPLRPLRMGWRRLRPRHAADLAFSDHFGSAILPWADFAARYRDEWQAVLSAWEAARPAVGLRTVRSAAYLAWRCGGHPHITYGVLPALDSGERLQGFAIVRPNGRFGWQEAVLTELVLAAHQPAVGHQLLHNLTRHCQGDYLIAHAAIGSPELPLLRRHGFWPAPRQGLTFTVRPLQESAQPLTTAAAWDLTLGDLELF